MTALSNDVGNESGLSYDLRLGNCIDGMASLPSQSFDLAIADPAYGAATTRDWGIASDHGLTGFGGKWNQASSSWDRLNNVNEFDSILQWLAQLKRLVKPTGSIWIHATYHNSGFVNVGCQLLGLEIINEVIWYKRNAFPNLACRRLTASHESILWVHTGGAKRRRYRFNYEAAKKATFQADGLKQAGKQLRTVWDIPNNKGRDELAFGKHPTQKPLALAERLLLISGTPTGSLLVPFLGSGTEVVAAARYGMSATGFEVDPDYLSLAEMRLASELKNTRERRL